MSSSPFVGEDRRHHHASDSGIVRALVNGHTKKAATVGVPATLLLAAVGYLGKNVIDAHEARMTRLEAKQEEMDRRLERVNSKLDRVLMYQELMYGKLPTPPAQPREE